MRNALYATLAAATLLVELTVAAEALPAPRLVTADDSAVIVQIADGCGRGRHFSRRRQRCVWN